MEPSDIEIAPAGAADLDAIKQLLAEAELPAAGVDDHWRTFVVARENGDVVGCAGSEVYHSVALVRSVTVAPRCRRQGVARRLVRQLIDRLASHGVREFYLLTTTAEDYFAKRGFKKIERDEMHPLLMSSREMQDACPDTAACMRLVML